jgi:hypothetical protein
VIEALECELLSTTAESLFVAIATDTGWFRYSNSGSVAYRYAAKLVELGLAGEKNKKGIFLFPLQKRLHAHEGAIWQTYIRVRDLEEKLEIAERKLVALGA